MTHEEIRRRILELYPDADVHIEGADCSLRIQVLTPAMANMTPLQRQRSIMKLFAEELQHGELHALTIDARASDPGGEQP